MIDIQNKNNTLRLLTWNLWFDDYLLIERLLSVLSYIEPLSPDIIAFQELTAISDAFFGDANIPFSKTYQKIRASLPDWQWYWEGVYSRFDIGSLSGRIPYKNSDMGRGVTILHVAELDVVVGCMHLESENEHPLRRQQFAKAIELLESFECHNMILLGDTNTRGQEKLNDLLPAGWQDAWMKLHPRKPGYTVDRKNNPMGHGKRRERLDRVFYCCRDFEPSEIRLIGTETQTTEAGTRFLPSDHFGVLVDFVTAHAEP